MSWQVIEDGLRIKLFLQLLRFDRARHRESVSSGERADFEAVRPIQQSQGHLKPCLCRRFFTPIRDKAVQEQLVAVLVISQRNANDDNFLLRT